MRAPAWAQAVLGGTMLLSNVAILYLAPRFLMAPDALAALPPCGDLLCTERLALVADAKTAPKYLLAAFPLFFVQLVTELAVMTATRSRPQSAGAKYTVADTWSSLTAGIMSQLSGALVVEPLGLRVLPYVYLLENHRLGPLLSPADLSTWVGTFLLVDVFYYILHRQGHVFALLWAGHAIHHGSEHYNLSTALRQSWAHPCVSWIYYLPLALCGVPPAVYLVNQQWNLLYQFWVHTCLIRRLPAPIEYLFSTPSHHRVHHDRRVHKNFGGVLIIWDRLFGTFLDERDLYRLDEAPQKDDDDEACLFGMMAVGSWREAVFQGGVCAAITRMCSRGAPLRAACVGPGWTTVTSTRTPADGRATPLSRRLRLRSKLPKTLTANGYLMAHFLLALSQFLLLVLRGKHWAASERLLAGGSVAACLALQGALLDGVAAAPLLELGRVLLLAAASTVWLLRAESEGGWDHAAAMAMAAANALSAASLAWDRGWLRARSHDKVS